MIHDYTQQLGNGVWTLWRVVRHTARQNGHAGPRRAMVVVVVVAVAAATAADRRSGPPRDERRDVRVDVHVDAHCVGRCCGGFEALYDSQACTSAYFEEGRRDSPKNRKKNISFQPSRCMTCGVVR
jgi:hypothetical protein